MIPFLILHRIWDPNYGTTLEGKRSVGRLVIISAGSWYKIELFEIVKTIRVGHNVIFNAIPWNSF